MRNLILVQTAHFMVLMVLVSSVVIYSQKPMQPDLAFSEKDISFTPERAVANGTSVTIDAYRHLVN